MCINKLHSITQISNHLSLTQEHNDFWIGLGPVCVMYSRMGLGLKEMDAGFNTHEAFYKQYAKVCDVLTIENVTEYPRKVVEEHLGPNWSIQHVQVDPRNVGLGWVVPEVFSLHTGMTESSGMQSILWRVSWNACRRNQRSLLEATSGRITQRTSSVNQRILVYSSSGGNQFLRCSILFNSGSSRSSLHHLQLRDVGNSLAVFPDVALSQQASYYGHI